MAELHAPKVELFDPAERANIDPKGIRREVDEYREEPFGLYLARPTPGRAQFHYLESWLVPGLGLRFPGFWFSPAHARRRAAPSSPPSSRGWGPGSACGSPPSGSPPATNATRTSSSTSSASAA